MGTLKLSLYYMEKMVWILFIVQIAWHDRGLLKQSCLQKNLYLLKKTNMNVKNEAVFKSLFQYIC